MVYIMELVAQLTMDTISTTMFGVGEDRFMHIVHRHHIGIRIIVRHIITTIVDNDTMPTKWWAFFNLKYQREEDPNVFPYESPYVWN